MVPVPNLDLSVSTADAIISPCVERMHRMHHYSSLAWCGVGGRDRVSRSCALLRHIQSMWCSIARTACVRFALKAVILKRKVELGKDGNERRWPVLFATDKDGFSPMIGDSRALFGGKTSKILRPTIEPGWSAGNRGDMSMICESIPGAVPRRRPITSTESSKKLSVF